MLPCIVGGWAVLDGWWYKADACSVGIARHPHAHTRNDTCTWLVRSRSTRPRTHPQGFPMSPTSTSPYVAFPTVHAPRARKPVAPLAPGDVSIVQEISLQPCELASGRWREGSPALAWARTPATTRHVPS